jgi:hypothetical protein
MAGPHSSRELERPLDGRRGSPRPVRECFLADLDSRAFHPPASRLLTGRARCLIPIPVDSGKKCTVRSGGAASAKRGIGGVEITVNEIECSGWLLPPVEQAVAHREPAVEHYRDTLAL